jgi:DNA-directed RNA polymerase specialized sigma24 family protein
MVAMIEMSLREAKPADREAFILYTMEGFTTQEIAVIASRKPEEVRASIAAARDHVRKAFPGSEPLKNRLIEHSKTA